MYEAKTPPLLNTAAITPAITPISPTPAECEDASTATTEGGREIKSIGTFVGHILLSTGGNRGFWRERMKKNM